MVRAGCKFRPVPNASSFTGFQEIKVRRVCMWVYVHV